MDFIKCCSTPSKLPLVSPSPLGGMMLASTKPSTRSIAESVTASAFASPSRPLSALMETSLKPLSEPSTLVSRMGGGSFGVVPPGVGLLFFVKPSMTWRMPLIQMASILSFSVASFFKPTQRLSADMTIASALGFRAFLRLSTRPFLRPTTACSNLGSMTGRVAVGVADDEAGALPAVADCDCGAPTGPSDGFAAAGGPGAIGRAGASVLMGLAGGGGRAAYGEL